MAKRCDRDDDGDGNCPWHPDGVALEDIQTAPSPEPVTDVENCVIFGDADNNTREQMRSMLAGEEGALGVLCADNHLGYGMPIGGVVAYRNHVSPNGVGYDIGCGNCAVRTDVKAADVDTKNIMDEIARVISFGLARANSERIGDHPVLDRLRESPVPMHRTSVGQWANQLGTVGSGNHYVDLFEDRADGALWVGVHFGSRGLGHKTASGFLALASGKEWGAKVADDMNAPPSLIRLDTPLGQDYLEAMQIAGEYAYAGRDWVVNRIVRMLGAAETYRVHNHHNFAWWEEHHGERLMVVRKGATPAFPGQQGFIGGSMGEDAVIVEGVDSEASRAALYSTVHGAGRAIGRKRAKGSVKITRMWKCLNYRNCTFTANIGDLQRGKDNARPICPKCGSKCEEQRGERLMRPGIVNWTTASAAVRALGIELRGGDADEAPECYKRLPVVLAHHTGTIKVLHTLRVIGVAMAGHDIVDPFKD